ISRLRTTYEFGTGSKAQELTPGQLLERMGFASAQLSTPVKDLSGGQKRRLQLLLILLEQPNVLILDEPTNDLDTDMLAAMKELAALERRLEKLERQIAAARTSLADHDQSDYVGLGSEMARIGTLESERDAAETRWFELTEQLG